MSGSEIKARRWKRLEYDRLIDPTTIMIGRPIFERLIDPLLVTSLVRFSLARAAGNDRDDCEPFQRG